MTEFQQFVSLSSTDLFETNGGINLSKIGSGLSTIAAGASVAVAIGGETVMTMAAGTALACGPIGWAVVACVAVGALAGGYLIGEALTE